MLENKLEKLHKMLKEDIYCLIKIEEKDNKITKSIVRVDSVDWTNNEKDSEEPDNDVIISKKEFEKEKHRFIG